MKPVWVISLVGMVLSGCGWAEDGPPQPVSPWCDVTTPACWQRLRIFLAAELGEPMTDVPIVVGPLPAESVTPGEPAPTVPPTAAQKAEGHRLDRLQFRLGWTRFASEEPREESESGEESEEEAREGARSEDEEAAPQSAPQPQQTYYDFVERRIVVIAGDDPASFESVQALLFQLVLARIDFRYGLVLWLITHADGLDEDPAGYAVVQGMLQLLTAIVDARLRGLDPVTDLDWDLWLDRNTQPLRDWSVLPQPRVNIRRWFDATWGVSMALTVWRNAGHDLAAVDALFVHPPGSTRAVLDLAMGRPPHPPSTDSAPASLGRFGPADYVFSAGAWDLALTVMPELGFEAAMAVVEGWRGGSLRLYADDEIVLVTQWASPGDASLFAEALHRVFDEPTWKPAGKDAVKTDGVAWVALRIAP